MRVHPGAEADVRLAGDAQLKDAQPAHHSKEDEARCFGTVKSDVGRLQPPIEASDLTAWVTDDFEKEKWITLHEIKTQLSASAFWHIMNSFTTETHWNRTIFSLEPHTYEVLSCDGSVLESNNGSGPGSSESLSWGSKYNAVRLLSRKSAAPIGGSALLGETEGGRAFHAYEWTSQWISAEEHSESKSISNIAVFGLCLPKSVVSTDNPRAMRYWPFQYPKVRCYRFVYQCLNGRISDIEDNLQDEQILKIEPPLEGCGTTSANLAMQCLSHSDTDARNYRGVLRYQVVPLGDEARSPRHYETLMRHAEPAAKKILTVLHKRMRTFDPTLGASTYVKRVHHDNLLPEFLFRARYDAMKVKYGFWVDKWTECTDPVKFVFEELSIAAYLCALWERERIEESTESLQSFVDCGCGNGFLVYLLISEGHPGIGFDLQKRAIWDQYPPEVTAALRHEKIDPVTFDCSQYDWIIGNHSDELSPWLPVMASRCQKPAQKRPFRSPSADQLDGDAPSEPVRRAYPRIFLLPCCFFDFDGKKVSFGRTRRTIGIPAIAGTGKYEQYYRWMARIMRASGFTVEYENLRIPSTKYVSLLGRFVEFEERTAPSVIKEMTTLTLLDAENSRL